jgi:hypothetical protein
MKLKKAHNIFAGLVIILILQLFVGQKVFSQTPHWNSNSGNINGWTSSSADVYRSMSYSQANNNEMLFINISTGWAATFSYYLYQGSYGWWPVWGNNGNGRLYSGTGGWVIGSNDAFVVIENPGSVSYVLSLQKTGSKAALNRPTYSGGAYNWTQDWVNANNGWISGWHFTASDKYVSGNFDGSTARDEVFFMNPNGHAKTMTYDGYDWDVPWENNGNGNLNGQWTLNSSDQYYKFDYDGNGVDELLCISPSQAKILSLSSGSWSTVWSSSGAQIGNHTINGNDVYKINKYKETGSADQLLILNYNTPSALMLEYSSGSWSEMWNTGSTYISGLDWTMAYGDAYVTPERMLVAVNSSSSKTGHFDWYPSAPQNIAISSYGATRFNPGHPKITWSGNSEPDMSKAGAVYKIYRNSSSPAGTYLATVAYNSAHEYIDNAVDVGSTGLFLYYRIKAQDADGLLSPYSSEVNIQSSNWQQKYGDIVTEQVVPNNYSLDQNFPNPFNPSTTINYAIPKSGNVSIKVYNIIGEEVSTIQNGYKDAGYYSVNFDASKLSSGIYVYKIFSGTFSDVKKMMLMK